MVNTVNESTMNSTWGRVDETKTVYVREGDTERIVGQFPDGTPEEALAYFVRKFDDLAGQVHLLEQRINSGAAGLDVTKNVQQLTDQLVAPAAVGDIASLRERVKTLATRAEQFVEKQREERAALKQEALEAREAIVAEAERIAAQPEAQIRWKDSSQAMGALFANWQEAQRTGPQLAKSDADALWKRFRAARTSFDVARRRYFAQMDQTNKQVRQRKEQLIAAAEALAPKGADAISDYRRLLDDWKAAGRASRKLDDQLWEKFKAAGDVLYQAKAVEMEKVNEAYTDNLTKKLELLTEAEAILKVTDHQRARKLITEIQLRWDEIGRVPREHVREVESKLRSIEDHVKKLEDDHWAATNPETIARSEGLKGQLEESIAQLQSEIAEAEQSGNVKQAEAAKQKLETQQSWLKAIG